jgi:radical SAM protein with 4Fe4S-binding SPASM domain
MLTNAIHRMSDIEKLKNGEKIYPHFVDFHTSDVCNHNCLGCAYRGRHSGTMLDLKRHAQAIDILMDHGVKAFDFAGGGEATMMPYLPDLMQKIALRGGYFGLITNGSRLNMDTADVLLSKGTYLRVSLEASAPWTFAKYKGMSPLNFNRIVDHLKMIVKERNERKSDLEISIKFSVSKSLRGIQHYQMMFMLATSIGVDRISIKPLRHEPEELTEQERYAEYALFQKARPVGQSYKIIESFLPTPEEKVPQCWLNPLHAVMDQNGDLYICCYYYYRDNDFKIGNIFEQKFEDIWLSDLHRQKIANIKKTSCAMVDCKFFSHDWAVAESSKRGRIYFL